MMSDHKNLENSPKNTSIEQLIADGDAALVSGDQITARICYDDALRRLEGKNILMASTTLLKMGDSFRDTGEQKEAGEYYQSALSSLEQQEGNDAVNSVKLISRGNACHLAGDLDKAESLYKEALVILETLYGTGDVKTASTLRKLGDVSRDKDDYLQAKNYYEEDLTILEKNHGKDSLATASTLRKLGYIYHLLNDDLSAKNLCERALKIKQKYSDNNPMATVNASNVLASFDCYLGNFAQAKSTLEKSIDIIKKHFGEKDNRYMAYALKWFARVECMLGKYDIANELLKKVRVMEENLYPNQENKEKGQTSLHVGMLYKAMQEDAIAKNYLENAQRIFNKEYKIGNRYRKEASDLINGVTNNKTSSASFCSFWNKNIQNKAIVIAATVAAVGSAAALIHRYMKK